VLEIAFGQLCRLSRGIIGVVPGDASSCAKG
jgi:hypothetical protein